VSSANWAGWTSASPPESARIVTAGRNELDAVRKWVVDAAGNMPNNAEGQRMLVRLMAIDEQR
jgi:hypothetical protein